MMKKDWTKNMGGPLPWWTHWTGDKDGKWTDVVFAVLESDAFVLRELFIREDAEWDYYGGLTYTDKKDALSHRADIEAFTPVRGTVIYGKIGGDDVTMHIAPNPEKHVFYIEHKEGCPVDDFVDGLGL